MAITSARGKSFLFTGKLDRFPRGVAERHVELLGGTNARSASAKLDVLVVGDAGSPLLGAGAKSKKHAQVEAFNAKGASIEIISESQFARLVEVAAPAPKRAPRPLTITLLRSREDAYAQGTESLDAVASSGTRLFAACGQTVCASDDGAVWRGIRDQDDHCTYVVLSATAKRVDSGEFGYCAVTAAGSRVWVGGYGFVLRSDDAGASFRLQETAELWRPVCMLEAGERLFVGGDPVGLMVSDGGAPFREIKVAGNDRFSGAVHTAMGPVLLRWKRAWLLLGDKPLRLSLRPAAELYGGCVTPGGALLLLGPTSYWTRNWVDFHEVECPGMMRSAAALADGGIVAGGDDDQLFVSWDDGRSFDRVDHGYRGRAERGSGDTQQYPRAFTVLRHGDAVIATGAFQATLRIE
ncbi:MAG: BRCT domain-containing protein [Nannocystaceae bacterium]